MTGGRSGGGGERGHGETRCRWGGTGARRGGIAAACYRGLAACHGSQIAMSRSMPQPPPTWPKDLFNAANGGAVLQHKHAALAERTAARLGLQARRRTKGAGRRAQAPAAPCSAACRCCSSRLPALRPVARSSAPTTYTRPAHIISKQASHLNHDHALKHGLHRAGRRHRIVRLDLQRSQAGQRRAAQQLRLGTVRPATAAAAAAALLIVCGAGAQAELAVVIASEIDK